MKIEKIKKRFETKHGRGSFERLKAMYQNPAIRFTAIAKEFGMCREYARQLYERWFAKTMPWKNGRKRRRQHRPALVQKTLALRPAARYLEQITKTAEHYGIKVSVVPYQGPSTQVSLKRLRLNRTMCNVYVTRKQSAGCSWGSAIVAPRLTTRVGFHIVVSDVPGYPCRYFVIPTRFLKRRGFFTADGHRQRPLYIPLDREYCPKQGLTKYDWWQFENAWHLVLPKNRKPTQASSIKEEHHDTNTPNVHRAQVAP